MVAVVDTAEPTRGRPKEAGLAERRREQILEAALDVFAEKGYEGTTSADLAARAGVAEATLYRYFDTKRAILDHVVATATQRIVADAYDAEFLRPIGSLAELAQTMELVVSRITRLIASDPRLPKLVLVEASAIDDEFKAQLAGTLNIATGRIEAILADGQDNGWVRRDLDITIYSQYLLAALLSVFRHALQGTLTSTIQDRYTKETARILMAALRPVEDPS